MVALLTGAGHGEAHARRMPRADTGHLTQTLVGLTRQLLGVPTTGHALESATLGDAHDVDHLVLSENAADGELRLHLVGRPIHLVRDAATVHLNLHEMSL